MHSKCGSLNVIGPHQLIGSGTIRRWGFAGVGVALLEEECHCGGGLKLCSVSQSTSCCLKDVASTMSACTPSCSPPW